MVLEACRADCEAALGQGFGRALADDREFMRRAVRVNPRALGCASVRLRADRGLVLEAVSVPDPRGPQALGAFEFAAEGLRAEAEVLLAAARANWGALPAAPRGLLEDRNHAPRLLAALDGAQAVRRYLELAPQVPASDRDLMLIAVRREPTVWEQASEALRGDVDFARGLAEALPLEELQRFLREAAPPAVKADRGFMLRVVRRNGLLLELASDSLRADREVVLAAARHNFDSTKFAMGGL